jgi:hypothetical protein
VQSVVDQVFDRFREWSMCWRPIEMTGLFAR